MDLIRYENIDGVFYLRPNDAIAQHLLRGDRWEAHFSTIAKALIRKDSVCVDCGANFGYNSVVMGKLVDDGNLVCFEPQRVVYEQLRKNLDANNIVDYKSYCMCVGETSESVELNVVNYEASWVNIGDTSIGSGGEKSETIRIDDLNLDQLDFIKIDVQGYEMSVLRGAEKTISRFHPSIFVELEAHHLVRFGVSVADVIDFLKRKSYAVFRISLPSYKDDYLCVADRQLVNHLINVLPMEEM